MKVVYVIWAMGKAHLYLMADFCSVELEQVDLMSSSLKSL